MSIPMIDRPRGHEWFQAAPNGYRKHIVDWDACSPYITVAVCGAVGDGHNSPAGDELWDDILTHHTRIMPVCCPKCVKAVTT